MSTTLYAQVAHDLTTGIASGRYPVGSLLPTEMELCEHYAASRQTIRAALNELQSLGLVSRRKRIGTRVETTSASAGYTQSLSSLEDLVQLTEHQVRRVQEVEQIVADRELAEEIGSAPGRRWLRIGILRFEEKGNTKTPLGWSDAYIDSVYTNVPKLLRKSPKTLIGSLIEAHYGRRIAKVEQTITAVALSPRLAKILEAPEQSPALCVIRRYLDQANKAFEISLTTHPAGRLVSSSTLHRNSIGKKI